MTEISLSIAMCTYNGERFLPNQLESFIQQNRQPDELIICDDGSNDKTVPILEDFERKAPFPTKIIINEINLGFVKNFEKAISLCKGDVIALSDQDDVWHPRKLSLIADIFQQNPKVNLVFSDATMVDEDLNALDSSLWHVCGLKTRLKSFYLAGEFTKLYTKPPSVYGSTMAIRRNIVDKLFPLPKGMNHDFWLSFAASIIGEVYAIPEELIKYRVHSGQLIGAKKYSTIQWIKYSKKKVRSDYNNQACRWKQIKELLVEREMQLDKIIEKDIDDKISHFEFRGSLPRSKLSRVLIILQELFNGRYHRYSSGLKSAIKDLIILI